MAAILTLLVVSAPIALLAARRRALALLLPLPFLAVFIWLLLQAGAVHAGSDLGAPLLAVPALDLVVGLRLDGLGLLFGLLVALIGALVLVHASGYFVDKPQLLGRFSALAYAFGFAMVGLVLASDVISLFIFWELTSLCSFLMIGLKHAEAKARKAALRALLVTGAGGIALLVGLLLLAQAGGTTSLSLLAERREVVVASPLYLPALILILGGAFTKSAQLPFAYWLPGAMAAPGPVSAFLHSATLVKAGVFLLARLHPVLGATEAWHVILGHVGALTLLAGALLAFAQHDLKRMLAWSTVAGLGAAVMLIGIGTEPAIRAALLFVAVHALYKAALFMGVGALEKRTGTRDVRQLRGLARAMPMAFIAALLAALSMAGLPPLLGAIAKELVYEAKLGAPEAPWVLVAVGSLANALLLGCALLVGFAPYVQRGASPPIRPAANIRLLAGPVILGALSLALGLLHEGAAATLLGGALAAAAPERATAAFVSDPDAAIVKLLSLVTIVAGVALFLVRGRLLREGRPYARLAAREPGGAHDRALEGLYVLANRVAAWGDRQVVQRSLLLGGGLVAIAASIGFASDVPGWPATSSLPRVEEGVVLVMIAAGALGVVRAATLLTAVTALGVAGAGVGLAFLLRGGPDLALTQIAVETLAVLLLLIVLPRGPIARPPTSTTRRWAHGAVALGVGAAFTVLALAAVPDGSLRGVAQDLTASSQPLAHGRNVVNVILVDFRALDTLGEIVVLLIAALGIAALVRRTGSQRTLVSTLPATPILRSAARLLVPLLGLLALVLFARGHNEPGGGFVAGLVAAAAMMLHAFAFPVDVARAQRTCERLALSGLALALLAGFIGLVVEGTFLQGVWLDGRAPAVGKLGTPLLFDAGVFLVVVGVVTCALYDLLQREAA